MGCKSSKELSMAERRTATGIGHTSRLPQKISLSKSTAGAEEEQAPPEQSKWGRRSIASKADDEARIDPKDAKLLPKLDPSGNLMPEEVQKRISGSEKTKTLSIGDRDIRYAVLTQTGFYPSNMLKPNQDAYSIKHDIGGEERVSQFVVYDGHGDNGHECAQYAKKKVPKKLDEVSRQLRVKAAQTLAKSKGEKFVFNPKTWPALTKEQCEQMCSKAYNQANNLMHNEKNVHSRLSGTTAITAVFYGNKVTIANVGDSRAVIGTQKKEESKVQTRNKRKPQDDQKDKELSIVATSLSYDQTPYRRDELDRVRAAGARVKTIDQLNNNLPEPEFWEEKEVNYDGDIPRCWKPTDMYPGTAFTRSLGDEVAEEIGVIAIPEVTTRDLTPEDRVLILASDGIFEFLTNQQVVDLCTEHEDPLDACKAVLSKSYEEWLEYETRVDDMTITVLYLD